MNDTWLEANREHLMGAIGRLRAMLEYKLAPHQDNPPSPSESTAAAFSGAPPALDTLCATFGLSLFERDLLLLCAGIELDSKFASLCATAQGDAARAYPTFSLALAALPEAHWSALAPNAPLRRWRLIKISNDGNSLTISPLGIDERILHYLTGVSDFD